MFNHLSIQMQVFEAIGIEFQLDMQLRIMKQKKKDLRKKGKERGHAYRLHRCGLLFLPRNAFQQQDKACDTCFHGNHLELTDRLSQQEELDQTNFDVAFIRQLNCIQNDPVIFVWPAIIEQIKGD